MMNRRPKSSRIVEHTHIQRPQIPLNRLLRLVSPLLVVTVSSQIRENRLYVEQEVGDGLGSVARLDIGQQQLPRSLELELDTLHPPSRHSAAPS